MTEGPHLSAGAREHVLALADDEHLIGARHTSWIGLGPFLEEDLAFCSIAQDELGHAIALYDLLLDDDPDRSRDDLDAFSMLRPPGEYRSCHLAERACTDWNDSLVRHWLYDRAETIRWTALLESSDDRLASIAARAVSEETFHLAHAAQFMGRITANQPVQIIESIDLLLPIALGIWDPVEGEADAIAEGVVSSTSAELGERWELEVRADLGDWSIEVEWPIASAASGTASAQINRHERLDGFDEFQADLRKVIDIDPAATW